MMLIKGKFNLIVVFLIFQIITYVLTISLGKINRIKEVPMITSMYGAHRDLLQSNLAFKAISNFSIYGNANGSKGSNQIELNNKDYSKIILSDNSK